MSTLVITEAGQASVVSVIDEGDSSVIEVTTRDQILVTEVDISPDVIEVSTPGPQGPPGPPGESNAESSGIHVEDFVAVDVDDDEAIEAAIAAAVAVGPGTPILFDSRTYEIADFHRFTTTPPLGVPGATTFLATSPDAAIAMGAPGGSEPTNVGPLEAGGFIFDGGGVATAGPKTNTVNWSFLPILVVDLAEDAHGFYVFGQNNNYDKLCTSASGTGAAVVLDNGAGGNRFYNPQPVGGNQFLIRETWGTQGYGTPQNNIFNDIVADHYIPGGQYAVSHRAGANNVFVNANIYHHDAPILVVFERNVAVVDADGEAGGGGGGGTDALNGALHFYGETTLAGSNRSGPQFAFGSSYVTGGAAGGQFSDIALYLAGRVVVGEISGGEFKWGSSTPIVGDFVDLARYGPARPLWTTDGAGAQDGPNGVWKIGERIGFGDFPSLTGELVQLFGEITVESNGSSVNVRSGDEELSSSVGIGRTDQEVEFGVSAGPNNFFQGTVAGDAVIRSAGNEVHIGVGDGVDSAALVVGETSVEVRSVPVVEGVGALATDADLTSEETARANADTALDGRLDVVEAALPGKADDADINALDGRVDALEAENVPETLAASGKGFVNHGAVAGTARPTGFASVEWFGSVQPTNAVDGDTWRQTP